MALVLAAFGVSAGIAAWVADPGDASLVSANASPSRSLGPSFDERFLPPPSPQSLRRNFSTQSLDRAATTVTDIRVLQAREQLARQMMQSQDWRADDGRAGRAACNVDTSVPLPRARPDVRIETAGRARVCGQPLRRATSAR